MSGTTSSAPTPTTATTARTYRMAAGAPTQPLRYPDGASETVQRRRAFWLLLLTLVLPGSAQLVAGNRRTGRIAVRGVLAVVAVVVLTGLVAWVDRGAVLSLATRTPVLVLLAAALVALAAGWAYLFLDAWRLSRPRRLEPLTRRRIGVLAVCLVLSTSGPLAFGAVLVETQRELISTIFGGGVPADAVDGRYNVLLLGGDAAEDRVGLRPDSIQLVSVDARTGSAVQVGLPRNLAGVRFPDGSPLQAAFPDGFTDPDRGMLNGVYKYGQEHPELFANAQDPGAEAMKDAVEGVTGLPVQYYALVDMQGFEGLIDALGGVEINVGTRVPKAGVTQDRVQAWIEPGLQRLSGADALWFARSRFDATDYDRMARQRCVMSAILQQMDPQTVLLRFQDIAAASGRVVSTDIPAGHVGRFVDLALEAKSQPVTSVQLVPPAVDTGDPDFEVTRRMVADAINPPDAPAGAAAAPDGDAASGEAASDREAASDKEGAEGAEEPEPGPPAAEHLAEVCSS